MDSPNVRSVDPGSRLFLQSSCDFVEADDDFLIIGPWSVVRLPTQTLASIFLRIAPWLVTGICLADLMERAKDVPQDVMDDLVGRLLRCGILMAEQNPAAPEGASKIPILSFGNHEVNEKLAAATRLATDKAGDFVSYPNADDLALDVEALTEILANGNLTELYELDRGLFGWLSEKIAPPLPSAYVILAPSRYHPAALLSAIWLSLKDVPHLLGVMTGNTFELGPFVIPKTTPCVVCRLRRHFGNMGIEGHELVHSLRSNIAHANGPHVFVSAGLLADEINRIRFGLPDSRCIGNQLNVVSRPLQIFSEKIWRIPRCPLCRLAKGHWPKMAEYSPPGVG